MILTGVQKVTLILIVIIVCLLMTGGSYLLFYHEGSGVVVDTANPGGSDGGTAIPKTQDITKIISIDISILAFGISLISLILNQATTSNIKITTKKYYLDKNDRYIHLFAYNSGKLPGRIKIRRVVSGDNGGYVHSSSFVWETINSFCEFEVQVLVPADFRAGALTIEYQTLKSGKESRIYTQKVRLLQGVDNENILYHKKGY